LFNKEEIDMRKPIFLIIFLLLLLSSCSQAAPKAGTATEQSLPPTSTPEPTLSQQETATDTSIPKPEPTDLPPTEVPTDKPTTEPTEAPPAAGEVSFANDVLPIINQYCSRCHGSIDMEARLDMTSYTALMTGSRNGAVVIPGDADASPFVILVESNEMPKRGQKLSPEQAQIFRDWVNLGALDN
jgi:hypothetical protein